MKLKKKYFVFAFLASSLVFAVPSHAEDANPQLDRIEKKVDTVMTTQDTILGVVDENPLDGRTFGIELNPFRLLFLDKESKSISGTVSIFDVDNSVEFAFPFFYGVSNEQDGFYNGTNVGPLRSFTLDAHYRNYFGKRLKGFYISGFGRFAAINGSVGDDFDFSYIYSSTPPQYSRDTELKLGVGFGIGYRIVSKSGWYWGTSLSVGRYIVGENNKFVSPSGGPFGASELDDLEYIVDFELLKFGMAF